MSRLATGHLHDAIEARGRSRETLTPTTVVPANKRSPSTVMGESATLAIAEIVIALRTEKTHATTSCKARSIKTTPSEPTAKLAARILI